MVATEIPASKSDRPLPPSPRETLADSPRVTVDCYSLFDKWFPVCGMLDYTEGMYHGDPSVPYDTAQVNQINYVLDQAGCAAGSRILEIGCGNGRLLEEIAKRGAIGVGITISPEQVRLCRQRSLDARLLNYRHLGPEWNGKFDAVIANGPIEHFVQPRDAAAGRADAIYEEMFDICHRTIDPQSPIRRFVNTTIYFVRTPEPNNLLKSPLSFKRGSDNFHWAMLARSFGGWYPVDGQLERCACSRFKLLEVCDGTYDYHLTSEHWLRTIRAALLKPVVFKALAGSVPFMLRHPKQFVTMMTCMLATESWNWQFRGPNAPTRLLRQTWEWVGA